MASTVFLGAHQSASCWYRALAPAAALGEAACAYVGAPPAGRLLPATPGAPASFDALRGFETVVLQHADDDAWLSTVAGLRAGGTRVVYDLDFAYDAVAKVADHFARERFTAERVRAMEALMRACDAVTVATEPLAERVRHLNPVVRVVPNGVDLARFALTAPAHDGVVIAWSGGSGHAAGFKPWVEPLVDVLRRHPQARLLTVGAQVARRLVKRYGERVTEIPYVPIESHPAALASADVVVVPSGGGAYDRCRSDLRWLEAAALGLPAVVDPATHPEAVDGETALLARTPAQARAALERLVGDAELRARIGAAARAHVHARRTSRHAAEAWREALSERAPAFRFLATLDWLHSSGWDALARAFAAEFDPSEPVELALHARSSLGYPAEQLAESIRVIGHERISVHLTPPDLASFDCHVSASRVGEAPSAGALPALVAPTAELRPVPDVAVREQPELAGRDWAEPDVAALRRAMRAATRGELQTLPAPAAGRARPRPAAPAPLVGSGDVSFVVQGPVEPERTAAACASIRRIEAPAPLVGSGDVSFVVQGPVEPERTAAACASIRRQFPQAEIVLSTWEGADVRGVDCDEVVFSADPGPVGEHKLNINRLLVSSLAGVRAATRPLAAKVRSDLVFHSGELLGHWGRWPQRGDELRLFTERVLVPNVFMRRPSHQLPFVLHPSDWAFLGRSDDLERLFALPLMTDAQATVRERPTDGLGHLLWPLGGHPALPEQHLWTSALGLELRDPWHLTRQTLHATEASFANNFVILDAYLQFGVRNPKYPAANRLFEDRTLYQHADWRELYDRHCRGLRDEAPARAVLAALARGERPGLDAALALRRGGYAWEAQLLESIAVAVVLRRDHTGPVVDRLNAALAQMAEGELRAAIAEAIAA